MQNGTNKNSLIDILDDRRQDFPAETVGRLMRSEFVAVRPECTVDEALAYIRKHGRKAQTLNTIYVVDSLGTLVGAVRLKDLVLASPEQQVSEVLDPDFISLTVDEDQEVAVKKIREHDALVLPVLDDSGTLVGIITARDVMGIAEYESLEDFQKFSSIQNAINNPLTARIVHLYRQRIVWLSALVIMNVFSGFAISQFEDLITSMVSLVFFLPLLIDSGGNAGAQSATLMIRSLAIGDVHMRDWLTLVSKEFMVSLLLGVTMAAGVAIVASIRAPEIIAVVTITMVCTVVLSSLIGLLLPFILTKLRLDPATASAPLITSIADISGVLIYFSLASWFFNL
ncbi:magnesium transporter [Thalassoglobus sp.]|uniref:magnesium transporter n=1 Tax=Thalassoglobus sp. TaxID=2795869 RepID=UPI003AA7B53D